VPKLAGASSCAAWLPKSEQAAVLKSFPGGSRNFFVTDRPCGIYDRDRSGRTIGNYVEPRMS
jgi:hypothetical protein